MRPVNQQVINLSNFADWDILLLIWTHEVESQVRQARDPGLFDYCNLHILDAPTRPGLNP